MSIDSELKEKIDQMTYEELFRHRRFDPIGAPMWQGEAGDYTMDRLVMLEQHLTHAERVRISKRVGWESR